jgi:hypothetical protein
MSVSGGKVNSVFLSRSYSMIEEIMAMKKGKYLLLLLLIPLFSHLLEGKAEGCAACVAAGKLARESENKAFYALRILYERKGRAALPFIRRALKLDNNPPAQMRAAGYIADLNDTESIPQLEKIMSELFKRVSFSTFGVDTIDFQKRWIVAYTLGTLRAPGVAERIWERYGRFTLSKKTEVPHILSALGDPKLTEHLMGIISRCEDHQLMMVTLDTMATGGNAEAIPFLRSKIAEWEAKAAETSGSVDASTQVDYFVLSRKAAQVIPKIEECLRLKKSQLESREYPVKKKGQAAAYF